MKTLRTLIVLTAMFGLTFALSCGPGGGDDDPEICTNGVDDDGDGLADCADPDCATNPYCTANPCDNDGVCETGETTTNCPNDCPAATCDNDGVCDAGETTANCPNDCPAATCDNDGTCDAGETTANCPNDCPAAGTCSTVADLTEQDGCETTDKCTLVDTNGTLGCMTAGTVADYAECGTGSTDDCQAGAICAGTATPYTCLPFCDTTHACTGGACAGTINTAAGQAKLCLPYDDCDPLTATGCGTGEGCYIISEQGDTLCGTAGTVANGTACTYVNDCAIGSQCLGSPSVCTELCRATEDCDSGTCQNIGQIPGDTTLGICGTAP